MSKYNHKEQTRSLASLGWILLLLLSLGACGAGGAPASSGEEENSGSKAPGQGLENPPALVLDEPESELIDKEAPVEEQEQEEDLAALELNLSSNGVFNQQVQLSDEYSLSDFESISISQLKSLNDYLVSEGLSYSVEQGQESVRYTFVGFQDVQGFERDLEIVLEYSYEENQLYLRVKRKESFDKQKSNSLSWVKLSFDDESGLMDVKGRLSGISQELAEQMLQVIYQDMVDLEVSSDYQLTLF